MLKQQAFSKWTKIYDAVVCITCNRVWET